MNYFKPGDQLTLRNGTAVTFIASDPHDGACLIGEELHRSDGEIGHYSSFERSDIAEINGKPRTPNDNDRLNFLIPVVCGGDDADCRTLRLGRGLMRGLVGKELIDWAISQSPEFRF